LRGAVPLAPTIFIVLLLLLVVVAVVVVVAAATAAAAAVLVVGLSSSSSSADCIRKNECEVLLKAEDRHTVFLCIQQGAVEKRNRITTKRRAVVL
jgi:hypothetical protein